MLQSASALPVRQRTSRVARRLPRLGQIAVVALLALSIIGPNMSLKTQAGSGEGSPLRQALYLLTFLIAFIGMRPLHKPERLLAIPFTMLVVLAWCAFTLTWAISPEIGVRRLLLAIIVIWTAMLAVRQTGYIETVALIRAVLIATLVLNYLAVALIPSIGVHQSAEMTDPNLIGAWRGILRQKNFTGAICAFTVLTLVFEPGGMTRLWRWGLLAATVFFLVETESKTSMGIVVVALIAGWAYTRYNPAYRVLLIPLLLVIGMAGALALQLEWSSITAPLYNPDSFTGRAQIWAPLLAFARDHAMTGAGYGSFWNVGGANGPIYDYAKGWVTVQTSGHNGYLDLMVQIGVPGLILAVMALIVVPLGRLLASKTIPRRSGALLVAIIVFGAGHNMTESSLLDRDMFVHVFMLMAIALIDRAAQPRPLAAPTAAVRHG